jgi:hypothetical protein
MRCDAMRCDAMRCGALLSQAFFASLSWPGSAAFLSTPRRPWKVAQGDAEVAGFASDISVGGTRFARAVVRRAGRSRDSTSHSLVSSRLTSSHLHLTPSLRTFSSHLLFTGHILPADQPAAALDMVDRFISGRGWA